jgi:hypothetical protein
MQCDTCAPAMLLPLACLSKTTSMLGILSGVLQAVLCLAATNHSTSGACVLGWCLAGLARHNPTHLLRQPLLVMLLSKSDTATSGGNAWYACLCLASQTWGPSLCQSQVGLQHQTPYSLTGRSVSACRLQAG